MEIEAKDNVDKLYQIKRDNQVEYGKICVNRFQSLAKLSEGILTTLKKYMVDFDAAVSSSPVTTISTDRLFPKLLSQRFINSATTSSSRI